MAIVSSLVNTDGMGKAQKKRKLENARNILIKNARKQKTLWREVVKARARLIEEALHKNSGNNSYMRKVAKDLKI
jgi:hypothetical protein